MVAYEDTYNLDKELLVKANTKLTQQDIQCLYENHCEKLALSEPTEVDMPRYTHLQQQPHFTQFNYLYAVATDTFHNIIHTLDTGIELNMSKLLTLRDDIMNVIMNGEQFIDYLYNMMPNESEITYNHCFNCGILCYIFGSWIGMNDEDLDNLTLAGFLFDIGKTKVSEELIWKPDKLTPEEFIQMQHHIHLGYELLRNRQLPPHVVSVMIMHHERCDGSGYPAGLKSNRIDPFALIAAIADTYEALTHPRAQRIALTPFQAIRVFEEQGMEKRYGNSIHPILKRIADMYVDRRVCLTGNINGHITEIHEESLSRPNVFSNGIEFDLRRVPEIEIIRMI